MRVNSQRSSKGSSNCGGLETKSKNNKCNWSNRLLGNIRMNPTIQQTRCSFNSHYQPESIRVRSTNVASKTSGWVRRSKPQVVSDQLELLRSKNSWLWSLRTKTSISKKSLKTMELQEDQTIPKSHQEISSTWEMLVAHLKTRRHGQACPAPRKRRCMSSTNILMDLKLRYRQVCQSKK